MSNDKNMTRREAIKKMGAVAAGVGLGVAGASATELLGLSDNERKSRKMKILAINGSARKNGNTADMINVVLKELENEGFETEHIQLAGINP